MTRNFADLHILVNPKDQQIAQRLITKAAKFGYRYISIPFNSVPQQDQVDALKTMSAKEGLDFVLRADFKPQSQEDLMRFLRKFRRQFEIICVACVSKEIARQAAKDRRVDLLSFPSLDYHKRFFDRAEAELASCSLAGMEVDVKPLLFLEGPPRVRLLSCLRREVSVALEFHVPVVVSSGVGVDNLLHTPRDLAALAYLFGLDEERALDAVSANPETIVLRNREKLSSEFIAPGIRVIKEGKSI